MRMIPFSSQGVQTRWQQQLANAITDPKDLLLALELPASLLDAARQAARSFPLRVPWPYVLRMQKGDVNDPLLLQVLPLHAELLPDTQGSLDPVGDLAATVCEGVLHKYHGRVLIITTSACGIHCRYCFRRHFPYQQQHASSNEWQAALAYIRQDSSIEEVILSGGDPLSLADKRLAQLVEALAAIPHVQRLRLHTRMPVVLPARITAELCMMLASTRLETIIVLHCNHAAEIDTDVRCALRSLKQADILLLNQAVLLRGINDTLETQCSLQRTLVSAGVLPYYLHKLDRVQGGGHFDVSREQALTLLDGMRQQLPGYMVPRMVEEVSGMTYKLPL